MKITIKPLKGGAFDVELDVNKSVLDVKNILKEMKGWEVIEQKLIHQGKIMADEKPVSEYKVKEGGFIVCMVSKPKSAPVVSTPVAAPPSPAVVSDSSATRTPAPAPAPAAPSAPSRQPAASEENNQQFLDALAQLQDMGFPEAECRAALTAAFGDANRAVDFLMNGLPVDASQVSAASSQVASSSNEAQAVGSASSDPLAALRAHPQFNNLRRVVQSNPSALSQVLQQIGQGNPGLLAAIDQNREEFVRIMNEPIEEDGTDVASGDGVGHLPLDFTGGNGDPNPEQFLAVLQAMQQMPPEQRAQLAQAMGVPPEQLQAITQVMQNLPPQAMAQMMETMMQSGQLGQGGGGQPAGTVSLTPEEAAAIDRLAELGFPKHVCVEAYLACDKDEQMAANYLFTNASDFMDDN